MSIQGEKRKRPEPHPDEPRGRFGETYAEKE